MPSCPCGTTSKRKEPRRNVDRHEIDEDELNDAPVRRVPLTRQMRQMGFLALEPSASRSRKILV